MKKATYVAAVIGSGMIANEGHIPAFREMGARIDLKAICGRNPDTVAATANRFGIPHSYISAETMLAEVRPDIVAICTPNQYHARYVAMALEAGCHVICEKPVGLDSREVKKLYQLAGRKKQLLVACQTVRFRPEWFQAKQMIQDGVLGEIIAVRFDRIRSRGIPTWGSFHRKADNGGGAMADLGVHMLDTLLWMLGNPKVVSVTGFSSDRIVKTTKNLFCRPKDAGAGDHSVCCAAYDEKAFDVEEYATGMIRLENGIPLSFQVSWAANLPDQTSFQILGSKASLQVPDMHMHDGEHGWVQTQEPDAMPKKKHYTGTFSGHKYLLEHVLNTLDGTELLQITPEETINACCALELFYRSVSEKREVFLAEL